MIDMGFVLNVNLPNGLSVNQSYARIESVVGNKSLMSLILGYYVNRDSIALGKSVLIAESYEFVPSVEDGSANFLKQGYEYLKTLPEFSEAVDY
jgi:hypothetical protein